MQASRAVSDGLRAWYEAFNSGDPEVFGERLSTGEGVAVTGTAPGEGHAGRDDWIDAYRKGIVESGIRIEGGEHPPGFAQGTAGFATDTPAFMLPIGRLPTRLTAVLSEEDGDWKIVHLHFSVGIPDEDAIEPA